MGLAGGIFLPGCTSTIKLRKFSVAGVIVDGTAGLSKVGHLVRQAHDEHSFPQPTGNVFDTVVVGGGVSGIACAWKLQKSGVENFKLLELSHELGGNSVSGAANDTKFAWAAHYINTPQPESDCIVEVLADIGVITGFQKNGWPIVDPAYIVKDPAERLFIGGEWISGLDPFKADMARDYDRKIFRDFKEDMLAWMKRRGSDGKRPFALPVAYSSQDPEFLALDQITMKAYMDSKGWYSDLLDWYINYGCRDDFATRVDEISAWAGIHYFACRDYDKTLQRDKPIHTLTWPEGNAFLVRHLARNLSVDQVETNALAVSVLNVDDLVHVTYMNSQTGKLITLRAKSAVFAGDKNVARYVIKALPNDQMESFGNCHYSGWLTASVHVSQLPFTSHSLVAWDNVAYDGKGLGYVVATHLEQRDPQQPTVLTYYRPLDDDPDAQRQELLNATHEELVQTVLGDLWKMHPGIENIIQRIDVRKIGHAMIRPEPGLIWGAEHALRARPVGNIFFANSDTTGMPLFEEAVFTGIDASQNAMIRLGIEYENSLMNLSLTGIDIPSDNN